MPVKADKDLKLYYSIGEVAEMFGVNDTLLRFWEREISADRPQKGGARHSPIHQARHRNRARGL